MSLTLSRIEPEHADRRGLVEFFTGNAFPFHVHDRRRTIDEVERLIDGGVFRDGDHDSYWLHHTSLGRVGYLRFDDVRDSTPMFDLRLGEAFRGRGLGVSALRLAADHVFTTLEVERFEGQTRGDNQAMRSVFERAGWTKEAHYRRAWPVPSGVPQDAVSYAILRGEWETRTCQGLQWHDRPGFAPRQVGDVEYTSNQIPEPDELSALYHAVGWSSYTKEPDQLHESVAASAHVVTAREASGELIGAARVLSDFGTIGYLQDVLVHPDRHRRGVGRELVELAFRPFEHLRQKVLLADDSAEIRAFYESLGFVQATESGGPAVRAYVKL